LLPRANSDSRVGAWIVVSGGDGQRAETGAYIQYVRVSSTARRRLK